MSYCRKNNILKKDRKIITNPCHVYEICKVCKQKFVIHKDYIIHRMKKLDDDTLLIYPSKCSECTLEKYRKKAWGEFMVSDLDKPVIKEKIIIKPEWKDSYDYEIQKVEYKYNYISKMKKELLLELND